MRLTYRHADTTLLKHHTTRRIMPTIYQQAQKQRYRITLDIEALGDFDPHNINWERLFELEGSERCDAYVEDLSTPDTW